MSEENYTEQYVDGERLLKTKRQERKIRKGQKKLSFFRSFMRFFTGVLILFFFYYVSTMTGWYLSQTAFKVPDGVTVCAVNNKIVKTEKIQKAIKDIPVPKVPLYMSNLTALKNKLLSLEPIERVYVRRYAFPARVMIIVKEKHPVISISPDVNVNPVAVFTNDGKIISGKDYLPLPKEYKTLLVLSYGNKGDDYHKWNVDKINEIKKVAKYVETFSHEQVEYVDLRNPNDVFVKLKSVNIRLGKFDDKIYERIKRIPSILPEAEKVKSKIKYIDLSWEKVNYLKLE